MGKNLLTWFEEKYQENLKSRISCSEAFNRTIDQVGFDAYSSYNSFATTRKKMGYKKRKPKK